MLAVALAVACTPAPVEESGWPGAAAEVADATALLEDYGAADLTDATRQVVRSKHGVVASAARIATLVGASVLASGGNAADAAVATGFALAVVEPCMSGIGGRASILLRTPDGALYGLDGLNEVPRGYGPGGAPGYERAAVPGVVAALTHLLEQHGTWPLARVIEPAIRLAEQGFLLSPEQAARFETAREDLERFPGSRAIFFKPDGASYQGRDRFIQADLARTLRVIAREGPGGFYRGSIAGEIARDMAAGGGFITAEDLAAYRALPALPVRGEYRGYALHSNFRPASGHTVIQALQTMEHFDLSDPDEQARWAVITGQAMRLALADRSVDAGSEQQSAAHLTSRRHAADRAGQIRLPEQLPALPPEFSGTGGGRTPQAPEMIAAGLLQGDHTTHYSVVDTQGMAVALTQSLGPSLGTRLVSPGLGFLYATRLGTRPGSRPSSTIAPTLVLSPAGDLRLILGGAGDNRIITAVIQVISRCIDHGLPLEQALAAPRVHPEGGASLRVEEGEATGWPAGELEQITRFGFECRLTPPGYFGRVHAIVIEPGGGATGVAEPRWSGSAASPRRMPEGPSPNR